MSIFTCFRRHATTTTTLAIVTCLVMMMMMIHIVVGVHVPGQPGGDIPQSAAIFTPERIHQIHVTISPESLIAMNRYWLDQPDVPVNVTIDGVTTFTNVGFSYKGNYATYWICFDWATFNAMNGSMITPPPTVGFTNCPRLSYSITFDKYDDKVSWLGVKKISLNSNKQDQTALHDRLNLQLMADAGMVVARSTFAVLYINGQPQGVRTLIEANNKKFFAKDRFPTYNKRAIFKDSWPSYNNTALLHEQAKTSGSDTEEAINYLLSYGTQLQQALLVEPAPIVNNILAGDPSHPLVSLVDEVMDLEYLQRWMVMDSMIQDIDGPAVMMHASVSVWEPAPIMIQYNPDPSRWVYNVTTPYCTFDCLNHNFMTLHMVEPTTTTTTTSSSAPRHRLVLVPHDTDLTWFYGPMPTEWEFSWYNYSAPCVNVRTPNPFFPQFQEFPTNCDPVFRAIALAGLQKFIDIYHEWRNSTLDVPTLQARVDGWIMMLNEEMMNDTAPGADYVTWSFMAGYLKTVIAERIAFYDNLVLLWETNECRTDNGGCGLKRCQDDFIMFHCTDEDDLCLMNAPCMNGATCLPYPNAYTCTCAPGFSGTNCQTDINECASAPCQHFGTCVDHVNSYTCECPLFYSGQNCEQLVCTAIPASPFTNTLPCHAKGVAHVLQEHTFNDTLLKCTIPSSSSSSSGSTSSSRLMLFQHTATGFTVELTVVRSSGSRVIISKVSLYSTNCASATAICENGTLSLTPAAAASSALRHQEEDNDEGLSVEYADVENMEVGSSSTGSASSIQSANNQKLLLFEHKLTHTMVSVMYEKHNGYTVRVMAPDAVPSFQLAGQCTATMCVFM